MLIASHNKCDLSYRWIEWMARISGAEMDMSWVHPRVELGWVEILANNLGWVRLGWTGSTGVVASNVKAREMVRWGIRAGIL